MACGSPQDRPSVRRQTLEPAAGGTATGPVRIGDVHPSLVGWTLSISVSEASNSIPTVRLTCRDQWMDGPGSVEFGDSNAGISVTRGGRLWVPYPTIDVVAAETGASVGSGTTIRILGYPVLCGEVPTGSPFALGFSSDDETGAGATTNFAIPAGASHYYVGPSNSNGGPLEVKVQDSGGIVFDFYEMDLGSSVAPGLVVPTPWRPVPPLVGASAGAVTVKNTNGSAVAADEITVWWRFSLDDLR